MTAVTLTVLRRWLQAPPQSRGMASRKARLTSRLVGALTRCPNVLRPPSAMTNKSAGFSAPTPLQCNAWTAKAGACCHRASGAMMQGQPTSKGSTGGSITGGVAAYAEAEVDPDRFGQLSVILEEKAAVRQPPNHYDLKMHRCRHGQAAAARSEGEGEGEAAAAADGSPRLLPLGADLSLPPAAAAAVAARISRRDIPDVPGAFIIMDVLSPAVGVCVGYSACCAKCVVGVVCMQRKT